MNKIVLLIVSAACLWGCKTTPTANKGVMGFENNTFRTIFVDDASTDPFNVETIFDSVSFVRLSNEDEAMLGNIDQIEITDSLIIVRDMRSSRSVKVFSREGKYLRKIGNYGRGPGEYLEPTHMQVKDQNIIIWDQFNQALSFYDLNGNFQRSLSLPFFAMRFHYESDDRIFFNTVNSDNDKYKDIVDYTVFECDKDANIKTRGFYRKKDSYENELYNHNFFDSKGILYYHPIYCDTLYSMDKHGGIKTEYAFDFGRKTVPEKLRNGKNRRELRKEEAGTNYLFMNGDIYLTDNHVHFRYTRAHRLFDCIYSTSTHKLYSFYSRNGFFPLVFTNIIGATDDAFIGYFFPAIVENDVAEWKKIPLEGRIHQFGKERTALGESMKPDDNPIITFFYPGKAL